MKTNGLRQIAEKAGCSCATVSRVLNNRHGISERVRKKILLLAREMNYAASSGKRIVTLFAKLDVDGFDIYTMLLLHAAMIELHKAKFRVEVLFDSDVDMIGERYTCGAVSLLPIDRIASVWGRKRSQPLVCINDYSDFPGGVPSVSSDDRRAISDAVDYLIARGHRNIALLVNESDTLNIAARIEAFEKYCTVRGARIRGSIVKTGSRFLASLPMEQYIRKLPEDCSAVIAPAEGFGERLYHILKALRPEIALMPWCYPLQNYAPAAGLPFMQQDFTTLAATAVRMLQDQLRGIPVSNRFVPYLFHPEAGSPPGEPE